MDGNALGSDLCLACGDTPAVATSWDRVLCTRCDHAFIDDAMDEKRGDIKTLLERAERAERSAASFVSRCPYRWRGGDIMDMPSDGMAECMYCDGAAFWSDPEDIENDEVICSHADECPWKLAMGNVE